jgi:hypothetical protein
VSWASDRSFHGIGWIVGLETIGQNAGKSSNAHCSVGSDGGFAICSFDASGGNNEELEVLSGSSAI